MLLRAILGINLLLHGVVRLPKLDTFASGLSSAFEETVLPSMLVYGFGIALPLCEAAMGAFVLLGKWTREALAFGAVLMGVLVFGTAPREQCSTLGTQMLYALVY